MNHAQDMTTRPHGSTHATTARGGRPSIPARHVEGFGQARKRSRRTPRLSSVRTTGGNPLGS